MAMNPVSALLRAAPACAALLCLVHGAFAGDSDQRWRSQRADQRKEREEYQRILATDASRRAKEAEKQLRQLVAKAGAEPSAAQIADLQEMLRGIRHLDEGIAGGLTDLIPAKAGADLAAQPAKAWSAEVRKAERVVIRPLETLFNQAVTAGYPALAFTVSREVLAFEPDHEEFHRIMGETRVDGAWYGTREMEMVKAGLRWDHGLGWVVAKDRARYDKGDYYDLSARAWTTLAAAQSAHQSWKTPWSVRTEHLEVRGTADLKALVHVADRLEALHEQVFAAFSGFFLDPKQKDPKLLFGTLKREPLVVNVARDEDDYRRSLPPGVAAGWSAGMFIPSAKASFFYAGYEEAIFHEFTHQILHLFTGTDRSPAWACEGIAVYSESPVWVDGTLVFGRLADNHKVLGHIFGLYASPPLELKRLLAIEDGRVWSASPDPGPQYGAAGAFATYCMESDKRAHREDFVDFLRDSYRGLAGSHAVWDYLGMDQSRLDQGFAAWLDEQRKSLPKPNWHFGK